MTPDETIRPSLLRNPDPHVVNVQTHPDTWRQHLKATGLIRNPPVKIGKFDLWVETEALVWVHVLKGRVY